MPLRFAVTKSTGQGEQLVIDVCQWNPVTGEIVHETVDEMQKVLEHAMKFSDIRMMEMNMRHLEASRLDKYFDDQTWQKVVSILDILSGRQNAAQVALRWHSEIEETQDLEAARVKAYQDAVYSELHNMPEYLPYDVRVVTNDNINKEPF